MSNQQELTPNFRRNTALVCSLAGMLWLFTGCATIQQQNRQACPSCGRHHARVAAPSWSPNWGSSHAKSGAGSRSAGQQTDSSVAHPQIPPQLPTTAQTAGPLLSSKVMPPPVPPSMPDTMEIPGQLATDEIGRPLALDSQARDECAVLRDKTEELQQQLEQLRTQIEVDAANRESMSDSLVAVNGQVGALSMEVDYWKKEISRIDTEVAEQHKDDMASLDMLSELVSRLPRPDIASASETRFEDSRMQ